MDAVKFLEERARMCGHGCKNCPAYGDDCNIDSSGCDYESLVKAVEAWAAEHPRKTRQSEFLKQCPNASVSEDGVLFCPKTVNTAYFCYCKDKECADCRREFWMQEVE